MARQEETPGQTQILLEGLHLLAGLKRPWYSSRVAEEGGWEEGALGIPVASTIQPQISHRHCMDGLMHAWMGL